MTKNVRKVKYEVLSVRRRGKFDRLIHEKPHRDYVAEVKLEDGEVLKVNFWGGLSNTSLEECLQFYLGEILENRVKNRQERDKRIEFMKREREKLGGFKKTGVVEVPT